MTRNGKGDIERPTDRGRFTEGWSRVFAHRCPGCGARISHELWQDVTCECGFRLVFDEDGDGKPFATWEVGADG